VSERGGFGMLPELGYSPVNRYLPPRKPPVIEVDAEPTPRTGLLERLQALTAHLIRR
jgi:hypothetical protein